MMTEYSAASAGFATAAGSKPSSLGAALAQCTELSPSCASADGSLPGLPAAGPITAATRTVAKRGLSGQR